jgi:hypothetical protein
MKAWYYLAALAMLCCMAIPAYSQEQVTLTVYVHDGSLDGALLSGVQITGQDAEGNVFKATTNSDGLAKVTGEPGAWQFAFQKDGYDMLFLKYNATQSEETAAYLEKSATSQEMVSAEQTASETTSAQANPSSEDQVELTVYVHEGGLNGALLSKVLITGQDGSGNDFERTTDSSGSAVISGVPGTWTFSFVKDGYATLDLRYNATKSEETAAYLETAA